MESCGSFCISEKENWEKALQFSAPRKEKMRGDEPPHGTGASLDREALSLYMFTYTARETAEAGLLFYRARYMAPAIGKFISEDSRSIASAIVQRVEVTDLLSANMKDYTYVDNNPLRWIDPEGLKKEPKLPKAKPGSRRCNDNDWKYCRRVYCYPRPVDGCYVSWIDTVLYVQDGLVVTGPKKRTVNCNCREEEFCDQHPSICYTLPTVIIGILCILSPIGV